MLIALAIIGSVACVLMGVLVTLIVTKVITPDTRLHELASKVRQQDLEMEEVYDQLVKWNKRDGVREARAAGGAPAGGKVPQDPKDYRRAILRKYQTGAVV